MNAFVTYEVEQSGDDLDTAVIHRVFVGTGNLRELRREFHKDVDERFGPQPEQVHYTVKSIMDGTDIKVTDPQSEQVIQNYRATVWAAKTPHRFGEWLVERKGWKQAEDVHQEAV